MLNFPKYNWKLATWPNINKSLGLQILLWWNLLFDNRENFIFVRRHHEQTIFTQATEDFL